MNRKILSNMDFDIWIWIITIVELIASMVIIKIYSNIYSIELFLLIVLMQPFIYTWGINKKEKFKKYFKFIGGGIMIAIPLTIIITLPKYTYDQGEKLIEKSIGKVEFIELDKKEKSIYFKMKKQYLFMRDEVYQYKVIKEGQEEIIKIDPNTGYQY